MPHASCATHRSLDRGVPHPLQHTLFCAPPNRRQQRGLSPHIHFLKSHSLCYNLVSVTITDLAMTPLVLHRHYRELPAGDKFRNTALACCNRMQLHRICDAEQSQSSGGNTQPAKSDNPERAAFAYRRVVNPFMQQSPFGCKKIFLPPTFEMNESPLPFTKHKMLYARQRDHFIIGIIA